MNEPYNTPSHVINFLRKSYSEGRLVHAYLFFGGDKDEKINIAKKFAKLVLGDDEVTSRLIDSDEHANVITIRPDGKRIKKEQIIFLKTEIAKKSVENRAKIYIIEAADKMSISAANSLLKFLEEPAPDVYIILISPSKEGLLSTIVSRTVNLGFRGLSQSKTEISEEIFEVIKQLEQKGASLQVIVAKNADLFKERLLEFLDGYQAYYRDVMNERLGCGVDVKNEVRDCVRKLRAIEEAKRSLQYHMNVQLCLDKLWIDFG